MGYVAVNTLHEQSREHGAWSITLALAWVVNIPRENKANIGPPVVPNIVALICKNQ